MPEETYHDRFVEGIFFYMAEHGLQEKGQLQKTFDIPYMTMLKILDYSQKPTTAQCIELCEKAGYSANWLFLGVGEKDLQHQVSLNEIYETVTGNKAHKPLHKRQKKQ